MKPDNKPVYRAYNDPAMNLSMEVLAYFLGSVVGDNDAPIAYIYSSSDHLYNATQIRDWSEKIDNLSCSVFYKPISGWMILNSRGFLTSLSEDEGREVYEEFKTSNDCTKKIFEEFEEKQYQSALAEMGITPELIKQIPVEAERLASSRPSLLRQTIFGEPNGEPSKLTVDKLLAARKLLEANECESALLYDPCTDSVVGGGDSVIVEEIERASA